MKINLTTMFFSALFLLVAVSTLTTTIYAQKGEGAESKKIILEQPFYVENYKDIAVELQPLNKSFAYIAPGTGILNSTINVKTEAHPTVTFRNNETLLVQGDTNSVTANGGSASHQFLELGKYNSTDKTYRGNGIAIFNDDATGELSTLSNAVGIYKSHIYANGTADFFFWQWK